MLVGLLCLVITIILFGHLNTIQSFYLQLNNYLRVWGGKQLSILGEIHVNTKIQDKHGKISKTKIATFVVVEGQGPILFGCDNLSVFNLLPLSFLEINNNESDKFAAGLAKEFHDLFSEGLGCFKDYKVSIDIDSQVATT